MNARNWRNTPLFTAAIMAALVALKLWLVAWQQVGAEGSARFDDALFVELARHLKAGEWLGPYDERALVKGPVYPMWIALTSTLGLPLLPAQHVLHVAAAAAVVFAARGIICRPWARVALFAVLMFDPATYESTAMRVTREGIYPALTMFTMAGLMGIVSQPEIRGGALGVWSAALGLALGLFWFTREEGPWIAPAVAIALVFAALQSARAARGRAPVDRGRERLCATVVLLLPGAVALLCGGLLAWTNQRQYGTFCTIELKSAWFEQAYGAVTRVAPENHVDRVPLPNASREIAYTASPAFAELRPYLDGTGEGSDTEDFSLSRFGEMTGTWFIWAFRDAAASAGYHESLPRARDYYRRVATEIDTACADGVIPCGPARASLAPPWRREYLGRLPGAFAKLAHILFSMRQVEIEQFPSVGNPELIAPFAEVVHMRIEGVDPAVAVRGVVRREALRAVRDLYGLALYPLTGIAIVVLLVGTVHDLRKRTLSPALVLCWAVAAAVAARLTLLAYISVSAYPIYQGLYLRVLYPLVYLFAALCISHAATGWAAPYLARLTARRVREPSG